MEHCKQIKVLKEGVVINDNSKQFFDTENPLLTFEYSKKLEAKLEKIIRPIGYAVWLDIEKHILYYSLSFIGIKKDFDKMAFPKLEGWHEKKAIECFNKLKEIV